jgi:hypothetical protein
LIGRQCRFRALFITFFKAISATKAVDCFSYGERFTTTIPLHVVTKLTGHSLAYKSQRKKMKRKKKEQNKGGGDREREKKRTE